VNECPPETNAHKTMPLCRRLQSEPVMPGQRNVDRDCPVPGVFHPADRPVPLIAAMAGIHGKGLADICPQGFQRIEAPFRRASIPRRRDVRRSGKPALAS